MEDLTHLVVNWIDMTDDKIILVGATDNLSWGYDIEDGFSGSDARTIVCATITDNGKGIANDEKALFYCLPGDHTRALAMSFLEQLFEMAWVIKNENLSYEDARARYFGKIVKK